MGHASGAATVAPTAAIGGRYRVERLLGKGGMGAVYAVVDQTSGRRVALKRLSAGASPNVAALFEREYHTLAGLHHPCIVQVYDYGSDADGAYYSMELIDGVDLSRAAPMPWRAVCRDLRDVASILGVLHARQLLHRDLSPRNLLRSESGRLKLIDFGALASFGPNKELVGTPPFIAPEVLRNASLDQRVDLFALGALAYWLITGVHAFPARQLAELPELWEAEFTPPSELQALVKNELDEPVPHDLDALIASLLRIEPAERLSSTAELIDQLNSIADLEPESNELTVQGYLDSKAFVGRTRERDRVLAQLKEASLGAVQTVLVEGDAGVGRTRFLRELVVVSQLAGALPVFVDSGLGTRPYGIAEALVFELLRAMPEPVRAAAREHAAALSSVSRELHTELHLTARSSTLYAAAETRIRQLAALRDLVLTLSRDRPLAFFIDDFQEIDEESQALIAALAHAEAAHKLTIVAALGRDDKRETSAALSSLRTVATRLRLLPLNREELSDLLGSVFGRPPYLERLSERLYRASDGNPAYCLELARHLVQSGLARYQDGMWSLPADLAPESLPKSRQAAHLGQLERLSPDARELARLMSIPTSGALSQDECVAISELLPERVRELLAELEREGVLRVGASGYRFAHDTVQAALATELAEPERKAAHLRLGTRLAATSAGDVFVELDAAVHLLRGGDLPRAYAHLKSAVAFYGRGDLSSLNRTAPLLEESYRLLREREQDVYGTVGVLGLLAIAGYFADRKYAARYGDLAVTAYRQVLRFSMLERLTRFVGGKLALIVTLVIAGLQLHRRRQRTPPFKQLMRQFMGAMGSLAGTAACSIDPDAVDRYAAVLRPFTVLGKDHAATITYRFSANFGPYLRDLPSASDALLRGLLARLESPVPIRDLP
ncbi:MAG: diguanylate cyclase, partial [Myxococcaceae bacterium]|nr:diguanylate cyclase [Myxococcaceae bacterium]